MSSPILNQSPALSRLYAFLLKLRPLKYGTLMPFSGELVHAAWLSWLRSAAPDVADWLHEGNKRRLFTCSSLQFPLPRTRMFDAERDNIHMPVDPEKLYTLRVTLLLGRALPALPRCIDAFQRAIFSSINIVRQHEAAIHAVGQTNFHARKGDHHSS
jgi:hypothetical protein